MTEEFLRTVCMGDGAMNMDSSIGPDLAAAFLRDLERERSAREMIVVLEPIAAAALAPGA